MTPTTAEMIQSIDKHMKTISVVTHDLNTPDQNGKVAGPACVYAAYLWSLVLDALRQNGVKIVLNSNAGSFCIRRGNGTISNPSGKYSHVDLSVGTKEYELHTSVTTSTRSPNTEVELDVAIFSHAACRKCRKQGGPPPFLTNRLFIEAKFYADDVSTTEAKAVLGVWHRIGGTRKWGALVSCADITTMARSLVNGAQIDLVARPEVSPLAAHKQNESAFVAELRVALRQVL